MKYYVYISDSKVEMLYDQIPLRLRDRMAAELKIDVKVLSTTISEKPTDATRLSRLRVVTEYIDRNEAVGQVDRPSKYFRGTMRLRWGPFSLPSSEPRMIYFSGVTQRTRLHALCTWGNRSV